MGRNRWEKPYKYIAEEEIRRYRRKTGQKTGKKKRKLEQNGKKIRTFAQFSNKKGKELFSSVNAKNQNG